MPPLGHLQTTKTWRETKREIETELARWRIKDYIIWPKGKEGTSAQIDFTLHDRELELHCQRFPTYDQNLRAVYQVIETLRKADQRGILFDLATTVSRLVLPAPVKKRAPHEVLQISPTAPLDVAENMYKYLARKLHPDQGGSEEAMKELNAAMEEYRLTHGAAD